jgi:hypothetical protein
MAKTMWDWIDKILSLGLIGIVALVFAPLWFIAMVQTFSGGGFPGLWVLFTTALLWFVSIPALIVLVLVFIFVAGLVTTILDLFGKASGKNVGIAALVVFYAIITFFAYFMTKLALVGGVLK